MLPALAPDDAIALLRRRAIALEIRLTQSNATRALAREQGLPRLFMLESEYGDALTRAELDFVHTLVNDLENEKLDGLEEWRGWYTNDHEPRQWFPTEGNEE